MLEYLDEFNKALANYQLSEHGKEVLAATNLVVLTGASASGRNKIIMELLKKTNDYHFVVSDTTRQPRMNHGVPEENGVDYWFHTEAEILKALQEGEFLEAEVIHQQQVSGISIRELAKANAEQKIAIADIDIGGVLNIMKLKPDVTTICVVPPSFSEWQFRLQRRGRLEKDEYRRRMETALRVYGGALQLPNCQFVINDDLDESIAMVREIAEGHTTEASYQRQARDIAEMLVRETQKILN